METLEKIDCIKSNLAKKAGEILSYSSWDDEFCRKEINELAERIIKDIGRVSLAGMSSKDADAAGFGKWDEGNNLRLIPIWLYPFLTAGEELTIIDGNKTVVGEDYTNPNAMGYIDNDHRFGYLAYGILTV